MMAKHLTGKGCCWSGEAETKSARRNMLVDNMEHVAQPNGMVQRCSKIKNRKNELANQPFPSFSYHSLSNYYYVISLQGVSMTTRCVKLTITFWYRMGCGEPVDGSTPSSTRCCKISALAKIIRVVNTLHASIPWPSDGQECMPHKTCQNIQC